MLKRWQTIDRIPLPVFTKLPPHPSWGLFSLRVAPSQSGYSTGFFISLGGGMAWWSLCTVTHVQSLQAMSIWFHFLLEGIKLIAYVHV